MLELGKITITANAQRQLNKISVLTALERHSKGDWGDLEKDDWKANDEALNNGGRILSSYKDKEDKKFWIITEWDRTVTTILLPEDY